jgi:UTP-glucose-1-phosphate uridylyltransferase
MTKPTLVVMAAGLGSRYGGLKQIDPIGPNGEIIIDYSIYDAVKAGFGKVVFIIKEELKDVFYETIGKRIEKQIKTAYVFQKLEDVPAGFEVPEDRKKPWGTAHAVMSCRNVVDTPFAVINADDYYGVESFKVLSQYLSNTSDKNGFYQYSMVGFVVENTLTDHGHVARGVCTVDSDGYLKEIHERTRIEKFGEVTKYTEDGENWVVIPKGSIVSMNIWGFTPSIFKELETRFPQFLESGKDNILKAEYFLPEVVGSLLAEKKASCKVLTSNDRWYGVTYHEDKPLVKQAISDLIQKGVYPEKLWEDAK